eukprot:CAMPEP_0170579544 /NCGR_PEP_ID=MMETSP0224-20130122/6039_1 /TAXON_ID=285029 /ORGANISM="Togula jolla, Strain CCCM 725" /LENGTH=304 /DNA_ID=CAMNT_0010902573 /DNA_START=175 /DNA_END=1087 /DNA_ORIENTATION=+
MKVFPEMKFMSNYSSQPWPPFSVSSYNCLPRGVELVEASGRWFQEEGHLPEPVHVTADNCQRDHASGWALQGKVPDSENYVSDGHPYNVYYSDECPQPTKAEEAEARREQREVFPYSEKLKLLQAKLAAAMGPGVAGDWAAVDCQVSDQTGHVSGSCAAASEFAERLLMEAGGGLPIGWGNLSYEEVVSELLELNIWYMRVEEGPPKILRKAQATMIRSVLAVLEAEDTGTEVFMGHDTQLIALAGALDLTWNPSPYPTDAMLPGSALRFDLRGDMVDISYVYPSSLRDDDGTMSSVPAFPVSV